MNGIKFSKPVALLSAAAAMLLAPNPMRGAIQGGTAEVCAAGTCCSQAKSICSPNATDILHDHYYLADGKCGS